eukprot:CAMPEP_0118707776 /NCGR_PEP_ID=MMETSP0800-20121206/21432_1 /TAXON_ID=210618 ORGANISM="Striatella unipunctata, Strain CCMP2910" /NCGR_SAMPLE_ID=MMETSP0800 /ASSEMBLY_ACC=CAM_ASM_000638 /LENGTH=78 /DNA_ID=CAMNT_0006610721 /DNA_START=14 /DNA_END=250 /DNA_ORIENTATION=-
MNPTKRKRLPFVISTPSCLRMALLKMTVPGSSGSTCTKNSSVFRFQYLVPPPVKFVLRRILNEISEASVCAFNLVLWS